VDLLVNNAGFGSYGRFVELDPQREAEEIRLNCEAMVTLTHAFLPPMLERGRGGIINVCSSAGMQPIPYEAVYSATKAFAITFTEALWEELRGTPIRVLAVNPGPVPTEWQGVAGHEDVDVVPGKISAEQCVAESLEAYDRGRRSVIPGRRIRWFIRGTRPSPRAVQLRVTERMYRPKQGRLSE
jgi:short-subunit dehydrogenase